MYRALFLDPQKICEWIPEIRTYRSTRPIVEFTRRLLHGGGSIEPFNREGISPTCTQVANSEELVKKMVERLRTLQVIGYQTIAVICKTAKESQEAYDQLSRELPLHLIKKDMASFQTGIVISPLIWPKEWSLTRS